MAYLSKQELSNIADVAVALPSTLLSMGDWILIGSVKIVAPMRCTYRYLSFQIQTSTVDVSKIVSENKIYGNLGLVYVALRKDLVSGSPGAASALDIVSLNSIGMAIRDTSESNSIVMIDPGVYSWYIVNNCKAADSVQIPAYESIDFRVSVTGQARVEFSFA